MTTSFRIIACICLAVLCVITAQGADPVIGTFSMNVAKFRSSNGISFRGGTIQGVDEGNGSVRMFYERIKPDGTTLTLRYTYTPHCIDCIVLGGSPGLTVSRKQVGKRTYQTIWKQNGKIITTSRNKYSRDFRILTNTAENIDENGVRYKTVTVWERQ